MSQKIVPGKYKASILDYGIKESKTGNPNVWIQLNYLDSDGDVHEITWFGSLKEGKAQKITLETLLKLGLTGNDVFALGDGVQSGLLDTSLNLTIAVVENEYEGKKSMRVAWISNSGNGVENKLSKQDAKAKYGALNLNGAVAKMRQDMGIKDQPRKPTITDKNVNFDDIGF